MPSPHHWRTHWRAVLLNLVLAALATGCRATDPERRAGLGVEATPIATQPVSRTAASGRPSVDVTRDTQLVPSPITPAATPPTATATPRPCSATRFPPDPYPVVLDPPEPRGGELVTVTVPAIPPGVYRVDLIRYPSDGGYFLGALNAANGHSTIEFRMPETALQCLRVVVGEDVPISPARVYTTAHFDYRGPAFAPAPCSALPSDVLRLQNVWQGEVTSNGSEWIYRLSTAKGTPGYAYRGNSHAVAWLCPLAPPVRR